MKTKTQAILAHFIAPFFVAFVAVVFAVSLTESAAAQWTVKSHTDPMTDKKSISAWSATALPNDLLSFPYKDLSANLFAECGDQGAHVKLAFNQNVIIRGGSVKYFSAIGIHSYTWRLRLRFNDWPMKEVAFSEWELSTSSIRAQTEENPPLIASMKAAKNVLVEVPLKDSRNAYFSFDLQGAEEAIDEAIADC